MAIEHLGAKLPFDFVDSTFSRGRRPVLGWKDYVVRLLIRLVQLWVLIAGALLSTGSKPEGSKAERRKKVV